MKPLLALAMMAGLLSGCTESGKARRILENDGYVDVNITGWRPLACGKDDWYSTGFVAKKNGKTIEGTVCSGLVFKSSTIRVD